MARKEAPFYVGYLKIPKALRGFLIAVAAGFVLLFAVLAVAMGTAQDNPGDGAWRFDYGRQTLTGILETTPYPVLHLTEGTDRFPAGHTLLLAGQGKNGVLTQSAPLAGTLVKASGIILKRGDLDMLQLEGGDQGLVAAGAAEMPKAEDLGRWRVAGEICDGKCYSGAMRPGRGLAHKACAELCLLGGIPPVLVTSQPVEGASFLLITGPGGTLLPDSVYDHVAQYISAEGQITRQGDLLIFAIDPASVEVLP